MHLLLLLLLLMLLLLLLLMLMPHAYANSTWELLPSREHVKLMLEVPSSWGR
jgi:hypothetical protein